MKSVLILLWASNLKSGTEMLHGVFGAWECRVQLGDRTPGAKSERLRFLIAREWGPGQLRDSWNFLQGGRPVTPPRPSL
jgi:hypothetical protein